MNLDSNRFLGSSLGIQSIPTFLFIHNGNVVKKQSGADKNALTNNIRWLISTYNLKAGNQPQAPPQEAPKKTLQLYSDKNTPLYFEAEKWELPLKKLKEFATKHGYFDKPEYKDLESKLVPHFANAGSDSKKLVVDYALDALPIDNADDVVPFIDFFRICLLKEDLTK